MKKTMLLIGAVGAMMLAGGCAKGHQASPNLGAVSDQSEKGCTKACCSKDKAALGAVSGETCSEKKECCSKDKAALGAVSGETCSEKKECCSKDKAALGAVSGSTCSEQKDGASKCSSAK